MDGFDLIIRLDEEEAEAAEILVDGSIGGRAYRFLLDTGAARTTVMADDYTSAFTSSGESLVSGVFVSSREDAIIVPSLTLGPITRTDFEVRRSTAMNPSVRSLIGMDLLKDHCCHFLFGARHVLVDPDREAESALDYQKLFLDSKHHPYLDVRLGDVTARSVWDTGAGITLADTNFIDRHPALFQAAASSWGTDAAGTRVETPMFIMAAAVIGGRPFPPAKVAGVDLSGVNATLEVPMDLILGYNTLSRADWLFDFPRRRWALLKSQRLR